MPKDDVIEFEGIEHQDTFYNIYAKEEVDGFASDHFAVYADVEL